MNEENSKSDGSSSIMRSEYQFDYESSQPNRFATEYQQASVAVILDPDVASVFDSSEAVNSFLRSVIAAIPQAKKPTSSAGKV